MLEFNYQEKQALWKRFIEEYHECDQLLRSIAECISEAKTEIIQLPEGISEVDLEPAIALSIININDNMIKFVEPISFLYFFSRSLVEKKFPVWLEAEEFWGKVQEVGREYIHFELQRHQASMLLIVLNRDFGKEIFSEFNKLLNVNSEKNMWPILHIISNALPYLEVELIQLMFTLEWAYSYIKGDLAADLVFDAVESLAKQQLPIGHELLQYLKGNPDSEAGWFMQSVIHGIAQTSGIRGIFDDAFSLMDKESLALVRTGIISCSRFDYDETMNDILDKVLLRYKTLSEVDERPEVLSVLAMAYGNLLSKDESVKGSIVKLSGKDIPDIQGVVAQVLHAKGDAYSHEEWYMESLMNLAGVEASYKGITDRLDFVLCSLLRTNPEKVFKFLDAWIEKHPILREESSIADIFDSLFSEILKTYKGLFELYLSKWLNSDNPKYHNQIQRVMGKCALHKVTLSLNPDVLNELSFRDIRYIALKILGFVYDSKNLCNLAFSILLREYQDDKVSELVRNMFIEYISYNYPGESRDILTIKKESGTAVERQVATEILAHMDSYIADLRKLQTLKEFKPPERRVEKYRKMKEKKFGREVETKSRQNSVFANLIHRIVLKGGRASFSKHNGVYTEKSPLSSYSVSMEFPRGESLDPLGQAMLRAGWRDYKREDV